MKVFITMVCQRSCGETDGRSSVFGVYSTREQAERHAKIHTYSIPYEDMEGYVIEEEIDSTDLVAEEQRVESFKRDAWDAYEECSADEPDEFTYWDGDITDPTYGT